jgi:hypothetical protein
MPRYFFNLRGDGFEETDLLGKQCADDVAALGEAMGAASRILQARLRADGLTMAGMIEIEDERHRPVMTLPLRAAAY